MKKGDLVRLNVEKCFSKDVGGGREYPHGPLILDRDGKFISFRLLTAAERNSWYESPEAGGMNDAGETRLAPTISSVMLHRDQVYIVVKARCAPVMNYNKRPGMTNIIDTETGVSSFVKREYLEVVSER
jgi:hypothetical protein